MGLVTPGLGLVFWTTLSFLIVLFMLKKMAWKPILKALKEREESISEALKAADKAKFEMNELKAGNKKLLNEARVERETMLKEAREAKNKIVAEAKEIARLEANKMIQSAQATIENEKKAAINELKNQVATLSLEIAEKILKSELSDSKKQDDLVKSSIDAFKMN
jgi:F-type H+-transporting ATPase subunit b